MTQQRVGGQVIVVECRGGSAPGLTHQRCRQARDSGAPTIILIHRHTSQARITVDLRHGTTLSPTGLARATDLVEALYPLIGWGRGGALATLIELSDVPETVLPHVLADLLALVTPTPEALHDTNP